MLTSAIEARTGAVVMRLSGVLTAHNQQRVCESVIKAALEAAAPIIVDINAIHVSDEHAWIAFAKASWHVKRWPAVRVALVCEDPAVRQRLADLSIASYLPVYADMAAATAAFGGDADYGRHQARDYFGPQPSSVNAALIFAHEHLVAWSMRDKIPVASTVVTVFAENALCYSHSGFHLDLEAVGDELLVAISDASRAPAVRRARPLGRCPAGLDIVSALCPRWGNTPTPTGKTVWARIGPEDTFAGIAGALSSVVEDQAQGIAFAPADDGNAVPDRRRRPAAS